MVNSSTELVIEAGRTEGQYWKDLWRYRELFYFLAWRDILVRYKQTIVGMAWALIRPFLTIVVFTVVFGKLAKLPSDGAPYPILVFAAMLPWQFFANALSECGNSLIGNANLISKVYFPRLIVPDRDFRYIVPFIVQFGLYISPVGFSSSIVPQQWRFLYSLNPMVGVIDGFRWAILGGDSNLYFPGFTLSTGLVMLLFISGIWYFRRMERTFADVI